MSDKICRGCIECPTPEIVNPWRGERETGDSKTDTIHDIPEIVNPWADEDGSRRDVELLHGEITNPWASASPMPTQGQADSYVSSEIVNPWRR